MCRGFSTGATGLEPATSGVTGLRSVGAEGSRCKRSASIALPQGCHRVLPNRTPAAKNRHRNLHLAERGETRYTIERLITRRSQVQILPPLLKRPGIGAFLMDRRRRGEVRGAAAERGEHHLTHVRLEGFRQRDGERRGGLG